ncbi:MAG: NAD-dependent epimerase/dehydratase family protein [Anaerolineales bacterium]|nr:NAD-dependent epimerase/dehydratase family protein [Anaerolineales bacterium]
MTETALVTGATGFIGSALCRGLLDRGYRVRALHRTSSSLVALRGLSVERSIGDILDPDTLLPAMRGIDLVFHTAAQSAYVRHPELVLESAVDGTRNVLLAALRAGVRRVVYTSSIAAMGAPSKGELLTEEHTFNLSPKRFLYGYAKRQAEIEVLKLATRGLNVVIVNPTVALGPGDVNIISGLLVTEAARGWGFFWLEGGFNIVHIDDVVVGHLAAADKGREGERYILGGENLTVLEIFTVVNEVVGRRPPWLKIPSRLIDPLASAIDVLSPLMNLSINSAQLRLGHHGVYCDLSKSQRELGLSDPKPYRQAAQEAYDWYREHGYL